MGICIYHSADLDGIGSAALVKMHYPDFDLIPMDYGQAFPWDSVSPQETVFIVDFSLVPEDMKKLLDYYEAQVIWIDHHKTAIESVKEYLGSRIIEGIQEVGHAGIELTYRWIYATSQPRFVKYIGAHDLWNHEDPNTLLFHYGLQSMNPDPRNTPFWHNLMTNHDGLIEKIIEKGRVIKGSIDASNATYAENAAFDTVLPNGFRAIAINKGLTGSSVADSVYEPAKHDVILVFYWQRTQWRFSLYSIKDEINVGEFCKTLGGGGHIHAAGFQSKTLPEWLLPKGE